MHTINLTKRGRDRLMRPLNGSGGFQRFGRKLQSQIVGRTLTLTDADMGKVIRYAQYDRGGFEGRLVRALGGQLVKAAANSFLER